MKFRKTKATQARQATLSNAPSAPVVRYYRPKAETARSTLRGKDTTNNVGPESNKNSFIRKFMHSIGRWFGVLLIAGLLLANTGISSVGLQVTGPDQKYRTNEDYKAELEKIYESSFWFKNKLTLSSADFERQIYARFPEVSKASAVIPLAGRRLQIHMQFAKPLLRLVADGNRQALLSEQGVVVRVAAAEKIQATFRDLASMSIPNLKISEGQQVLTSEEANLIRLIVSEFDGSERSRPKVESIEFDVAKREIKVRYVGEKFFAKLTPEREARAQVGSLVASLNTFFEKGIQIPEYIDVRVDGRVFVR